MSRPYAGFAIDTLSYVPHHSLHETVDSLADAGCTALQMSLHPGYLWPSECDASARAGLRLHLDRRGVQLTCVNLPGVEINIASLSQEMRHYSRDLLKQNILLAGDLGAPFIVMTAGRQHPLIAASPEALVAHFRAALDELVPCADRAGVTICLENAPSAFLPDTASLMAAAAGHGAIGFCYDLPNGYFVKEDVGVALRSLGQRLKLVHVADTGQDVARHAAVGQGSIDFVRVASLLQEIGYRDVPVLEVIAPDRPEAILDSLRALDRLGWQNGRTLS